MSVMENKYQAGSTPGETSPDVEPKDVEAQEAETTPPMMSGKQPSAYTTLRTASRARERTEQRNCETDYARQEFYALINKAANKSLTRPASIAKRTTAR